MSGVRLDVVEDASLLVTVVHTYKDADNTQQDSAEYSSVSIHLKQQILHYEISNNSIIYIIY